MRETPEGQANMTANDHDTGTGSTQLLRSCPCSQAQLESAAFQGWLARMRDTRHTMHRKGWEYAYIAQALAERDMLRPGRRGLGFAVGRERLPALFAGLGCDITATDLSADDPGSAEWAETGQHASGAEAIAGGDVTPPEVLRQRVSFRSVDMRAIPADLRGYDFAWSSCSLEHLGTIARGTRFILDALECVRPGGVAVHTTEYNLSSNFWTMPSGRTVLFRRRDLEGIAKRLRAAGHEVDLDFTLGNGAAERIVDSPPYRTDVHFRLRLRWLRLRWFDVTSFGLIIRKSSAGA
jgi:hypothetical protein